MTSLLRGTIPLVAANGAGQIATAVALGIAAADGTPATFALVAGGMGAVTITSNVIDFGNNVWTVRETAKRLLSADQFTATVRTKLFIATSAALATCLVAAIARLTPLPLTLGFAAMLVTRVAVMSYSSRLVGNGLFATSGVMLSCERALGLTFLLGAHLVGCNSANCLPASFALGSCISLGSVLYLRFPRNEWPMWGRLERPSVMMSRSRSFGAQSVATDALLLDAWIVSAVASPSVAGLVALASRLTAPVGMLGQAMASVTLSIRSRRPNSTGRPEAAILGLTFIGLAIVAAFANVWIPRVLGEGYRGAVIPFVVYCVSAGLTVANQVLASQLQALGGEGLVARIVAPGAILALVFMGFGAATAGAPGAALGVFTANALITVGLGVWGRSQLTQLQRNRGVLNVE